MTEREADVANGIIQEMEARWARKRLLTRMVIGGYFALAFTGVAWLLWTVTR